MKYYRQVRPPLASNLSKRLWLRTPKNIKRKGVKKVLGIIIGLLEDRACVEEESDRKRARIEGYRSKK